MVFGKKSFTNLLTATQSVTFSYNKERSDMGITGSIIYNKATYALQQSANTSYFRQTWSADYSYRFKNDIFILTDMDYHINSGRTEGYNQNILLWNISAAKKFLDYNAEIKFTAYDILKQNNGINRLINENYFEDVRSNVISRFFLLSFTYNLNRMGGKKRNQVKETPGESVENK